MKKASVVGIVLAGITGAVTLLHVNGGHALSRLGGCPIGASAADVERSRTRALDNVRGSARAAKRPAAGFTLDVTTTDDVHAWVEKHHLSCSTSRGGMLVKCLAVPASALGDRPEAHGAISEVDLAFRPDDKTLVNVSVLSFGMGAASASSSMAATTRYLERELGPSTIAEGEISTKNLAKGNFTTAIVAYRFSNFLAEVTATGFGSRGVTLHEHYLSALD